MITRKQGKLFILSGPSGSGKSTILKGVFEQLPDAHFSVSATTRHPRPGEIDGREYLFIEEQTFLKQQAEGGFLESNHHFGNWYGTPLPPVKAQLDAGHDVFLDIEVEGAAKVREKMPEAVAIFLFPPSIAILEQRLRTRGTDTEEKILNRLGRAREEYAKAHFYDYLVINDTAEEAVSEVLAIIKAEHCKLEFRRHLIS
ncbi:MAG: guanylate kinase [Oscillospiraceae bacterium]|nr:guanylate kinase [Oscillospiraceae bacterium]